MFLQYFQTLVFYFLLRILIYLGFNGFIMKIEGRHLEREAFGNLRTPI